MVLRFNENPDGPVVMTKDELRALKGLPPRQRSPSVYIVQERLPASTPMLLLEPVQTIERRPRKSRAEKRYEVPPPRRWIEVPAQQQEQPRRYEVPPHWARPLARPLPFVLPAPLPQPVIAEAQYIPDYPPPPAPEPPPAEDAFRPSRTPAKKSALRVEVPTTPRGSALRPPSLPSPVSTRSFAHSHRWSTGSSEGDSRRQHRRRRSRHDTPNTTPSPSRASRKERKMIEDPSRGPRAWDEHLPVREEVVYRNADGTRTRHFYYE